MEVVEENLCFATYNDEFPINGLSCNFDSIDSKECFNIDDISNKNNGKDGFCYIDEAKTSIAKCSTCYSLPVDVPVEHFTLSGCECEQKWKVFGHEPCLSGCCSPDGDSPWCLSRCEPVGWGYCNSTEIVSSPVLSQPEEYWFEQVESTDVGSITVENKEMNGFLLVLLTMLLVFLLFILVLALFVYKNKNKGSSIKIKKERSRNVVDELF